MYDKLIAKLRGAKKFFPGYLLTAKDFRYELMPQDLCKAADVIEELSMSKDIAFVEEDGRTVIEFVSKWIPVEERLPDDGEYLVSINTIPPHQIIEVCSFAKDLYKIDKYDFRDKKHKSGFYGYDGEYGYFERTGITHWMPLPMPPESEET